MSKALTKQQIEHLGTRIESAIEAAKTEFDARLPKVVNLTEKQKVLALKRGQFTFKLDDDGEIPYNTNRLLEFSYNKKMDAIKVANEKALLKFEAPLYAEKQRIMDKAILGGAEEALEAMTRFIAKLSK